VRLGTGDGGLRAPLAFGGGASPPSVGAAALNGDGRLDLAVASAGANSVSVLIGNGDGTFQTAALLPVDAGPQGLAVADFDGDGRRDPVSANAVAGTASLLLPNGVRPLPPPR